MFAGGAAGGAAAGGDAAGGGPPTIGGRAPLPFCAIAFSLNAAWDFSAVGLMENTIPLPQWLPCLQ